LAFGDPISESQATDRSTFCPMPGGEVSNGPRCPGTEAALLGHSRRGIRAVCWERMRAAQLGDSRPDVLRPPTGHPMK
jgi:hypothetical protein